VGSDGPAGHRACRIRRDQPFGHDHQCRVGGHRTDRRQRVFPRPAQRDPRARGGTRDKRQLCPGPRGRAGPAGAVAAGVARRAGARDRPAGHFGGRRYPARRDPVDRGLPRSRRRLRPRGVSLRASAGGPERDRVRGKHPRRDRLHPAAGRGGVGHPRVARLCRHDHDISGRTAQRHLCHARPQRSAIRAASAVRGRSAPLSRGKQRRLHHARDQVDHPCLDHAGDDARHDRA